MRIFRKKSTWQKLTDSVAGRASAKATQSGLLAAGAAVGLTAVSSAVSAIRKKTQQ
jgi:hypothetical protein